MDNLIPTETLPDGRLKLSIPQKLNVISGWISLSDPLGALKNTGCEIVSLPNDHNPVVDIIAPEGWVFDKKHNDVLRDADNNERMHFDSGISFFGMGEPPSTILYTRYRLDFSFENEYEGQQQFNFIVLKDCGQVLPRDCLFHANRQPYGAGALRDFCDRLADELKNPLQLDNPAGFWKQDVGGLFDEAKGIVERIFLSSFPDRQIYMIDRAHGEVKTTTKLIGADL